MNYKPIIVSILLIIILLVIYVLFGPASDPTTPTDVSTTTPGTMETPGTSPENPDRARAPEEITLRVGQTGAAAGLTVTFNELTNDYRCPVDVNCIQAGAVVANITLDDGAEQITFNKPSDEVPTWWRGYEMSIVSITPEARSSVVIEQSAYQVTFLVAPNPETNGNEPLI